MVSKARDDLPDPDRPVITTSWSRGMSMSTFLRLCWRAPRTRKYDVICSHDQKGEKPGQPIRSRYVRVKKLLAKRAFCRYDIAQPGFNSSVRAMPPVIEKIKQAAQLHQAGRLQEAVDLYQEILRAEPRDWEVQYNMGNALRMLGKFGEAMQAYILAIRHRPDFAQAHNDLGVALAEIGRWQDATAALRRAVVLLPELTGAYNALGIAHKEQGRAAEAIPCFDRALACHPGQPDAHFARGECSLQTGDWLSGWKDYRHRFGIRYLNFN